MKNTKKDKSYTFNKNTLICFLQCLIFFNYYRYYFFEIFLINFLIFSAENSCDDIIEKENIVLFKMKNYTLIQGSKKCLFGLSQLTENNKLALEKFINCKIKSDREKSIKLYRINCKNIQSNKKTSSSCQTFLEASRSTFECLEICWKFPFDYNILCREKPISHVLRNVLIFICIAFVVTLGIFIGKNYYNIKVSFNECFENKKFFK